MKVPVPPPDPRMAVRPCCGDTHVGDGCDPSSDTARGLAVDDRCELCNRILDCCGNCPKCGTRDDRKENGDAE